MGPWVGEMLGPPYDASFAVSRQLLQWYAVTGPVGDYLPDRFPVFIWDDHGILVYGFPAVDGESGGVKVASESSVRSATVDDVRRDVSAAEELDLYDAVIKVRIPGLARKCIRAISCIYTTTPDGDFVVDRHPEHPSVMVASACSGHGFKHSAALGEAVAAEICGDSARIDLTPFRFDRLRL
jgi:sarcosine oxidase